MFYVSVLLVYKMFFCARPSEVRIQATLGLLFQQSASWIPIKWFEGWETMFVLPPFRRWGSHGAPGSNFQPHISFRTEDSRSFPNPLCPAPGRHLVGPEHLPLVANGWAHGWLLAMNQKVLISQLLEHSYWEKIETEENQIGLGNFECYTHL